MRTQKITIANRIPGIVYGAPSERVYLYVHGKMGCKEEALPFAELADPAGYQVMAIDLPEHGERKGGEEKLLPWTAVPEIQAAYTYAARRWKKVSLYAVSIGAWLSMEALADCALEKTLLLSPVVDMEGLWVREHPLCWDKKTEVLYGSRDHLTSPAALEQFRLKCGVHLTIMEEGEHWFHTELQLAVRQEWERHNL